MGDTGTGEQQGEEGGGVRSTLVTSLAANIFDTLKSNDDIATILNGVLDPARKDKVNHLNYPMHTYNMSHYRRT